MVLTIITEKNREASYLEQLVHHGSSRASSAHLINLCLLCLDLVFVPIFEYLVIIYLTEANKRTSFFRL